MDDTVSKGVFVLEKEEQESSVDGEGADKDRVAREVVEDDVDEMEDESVELLLADIAGEKKTSLTSSFCCSIRVS